MKLRIWWHPQYGYSDIFYTQVESVEEAKRLIKVLNQYDEFLYSNRILDSNTNAYGLEVQRGADWVEWVDERGLDITYVIRG
jgi:hypothetical protein